jgi:hypothetical protein
MPSRNAGFSVSDSTQAFIIRLPILGSAGPMRNQPPVNEPALVAALVSDNDGNVGPSLRGDVKAQRVLR